MSIAFWICPGHPRVACTPKCCLCTGSIGRNSLPSPHCLVFVQLSHFLLKRQLTREETPRPALGSGPPAKTTLLDSSVTQTSAYHLSPSHPSRQYFKASLPCGQEANEVPSLGHPPQSRRDRPLTNHRQTDEVIADWSSPGRTAGLGHHLNAAAGDMETGVGGGWGSVRLLSVPP